METESDTADGPFPEPGEASWEPEEGFPEPEEAFPEPGGPRAATGEPRVDAALARLDELAGRPVTEHRPIFEDVHRRLRDVLGELDTRQPSPAQEAQDATDAASRAGR
jgi:hypothetical protein